ncbi:hypothetical protein ABES80_01015 [Bacillus gobiensis]|uniref:hypothetical protein n=1 Tax=Bacillus gobiensis TaxID=1441095 RepID=UPI003D2400E6
MMNKCKECGTPTKTHIYESCFKSEIVKIKIEGSWGMDKQERFNMVVPINNVMTITEEMSGK